jgi:LPS O-antigen subunit length determinant protein (WzzB/FepE family)
VQRINERLRTRDLLESERRLAYLNDKLENATLVELRQAVSRLIQNEIQTIMLAQAEAEYAFKVIDPPRVPNDDIEPRRVVIVILATLLGVVVGVLLALVSQWMSQPPPAARNRVGPKQTRQS